MQHNTYFQPPRIAQIGCTIPADSIHQVKFSSTLDSIPAAIAMHVGYSPEFVHIWVQTISPLHMYALALNSYGANGGHTVSLNVGEPNKNYTN